MPNSNHLPIDEKLKTDLVNKLCSRPVPVKIYLGKKLIESHTIEISKSDKIYVTYPQEATDTRFTNIPDVEFHFSINQDMYFFKGTATYADHKLFFNQPAIIYKIQRRENFRVYLPPSVLQNIEIVNEKGSKVHLTNMSLTGGQISVKTSDLNLSLDRYKLNSLLKLKITLLDFHGQVFNCVIKFVEVSPKTGSTLLGVQFQNLDALKTQELQNVIAKLDRLNRQIAA